MKKPPQEQKKSTLQETLNELLSNENLSDEQFEDRLIEEVKKRMKQENPEESSGLKKAL